MSVDVLSVLVPYHRPIVWPASEPHTHTFNDRRDKGNKISTTTVEFFAAGLQSLITANKKERKKEKREKSQTYLATDASQETATMKKENNNHKDFRTK